MELLKEFVPYQESLELKGLGFDEYCMGACYYEFKDRGNTHVLLRTPDEYDSKSGVDAPLFQQAFRWFRDKYNIDAWVQPFTSIKSNGEMYLPDESYSFYIFKDGLWVDDKVNFVEPKEAELACLRKLIQIVKEKQ